MHIKSEKKEVKVVERWGDWNGEKKGEEPKWRKGAERKATESLRLGGEGRLELEARIGDERDGHWGRLFWRRSDGAGREGNRRMEVRVRVKNGTKKNVSSVLWSGYEAWCTYQPMTDIGLGPQDDSMQEIASHPSQERTSGHRSSRHCPRRDRVVSRSRVRIRVG